MSLHNEVRDSLDRPGPGRVRRGHVLLLGGVCLVLFLLNAHSLPLADPEEARCGLIVRDMIEQGHWLVPHLRGQPYFDKPAPFFWLAAGAVRLTGSAELGGRLVPALAGLLAVLVAYAFARRAFASDAAGLLAGLILATTGEFLFLARWYRMDMPFAAAMWGALGWFWRCENLRLAGRPVGKTKTWLGFYLLAALATLFKGPAGLALPGMVLTAYFLLSRQARRVWEFLSPAALAGYLLVAAPWFVAVGLAQPGYFEEFFLHQNLQRFTGSGGLGHNWPGIVLLPIVLAGTLPWTVFLPAVAIRFFPRRWSRRNDRPAILFLWLAALVPLTFFSLSGTKLPAYVLPVFAPLAVLIAGLLAGWADASQADPLRKLGDRTLLVTVALLPAAPLAMEIWLGRAGAWAGVPFGIALLAVLAMRRALKRTHRGGFVGWGIAGVAGIYLYLILHTAPLGYERISVRHLVQATGASRLRVSRVCFCPGNDLSFLFYAGLDDAPVFRRSRPADAAKLAEWVRSDRSGYCLVTGDDNLAELRRAYPANLWVVVGGGGHWLVSNRPPTSAPSTGEHP